MKKELLTLEKTFNLTSFFTEIKSSSLWNVLEVKTMLLLFKEISKQAVFLKDKELSEFDKINIKNKYDINLKEWEEVTGLTKSSNYYREFKKLRNNLSAKPVTTPHPLKPNCDKSSVSMPLFTKVEYLSGSGHFSLTVHEEHIKNLAIFVKYSKISFKYISKLRSHYSVFSYILIKLLLDSSYNKELIMSLNDFKLKISLGNKYKQINPFKEFVLDVIKKEVNELTQINLDYELIKEGRSFTKIKFTFDYKPEYLEQKVKSKSKQQKIGQMIENAKADDYDSPFEHILTGWNIRARKVVELEDTYSLEVIQQAIDLTLEKEKAGEIKTTKAAIFLGILENKQSAFDEQFERDKIKNKQQQEKQLREQVSAEYNTLSSFILSNQDLIQSVLTSNTKHLPITDENAIPVFKKLKSIDADKFRGYTVPILSFYHFESNSNVSDTLSDIVDRSQYIEIKTYKDDMGIVQAYKESLDKIKENEYITDEQKEILRKEVQETINLLLGL